MISLWQNEDTRNPQRPRYIASSLSKRGFGMPVYMNIDHLQRIVTMVAHGAVTDQEIRSVTQELIEAGVAPFGKIIDTSAAVSSLTAEQVAVVADMLRRGRDHDRRGPVAYVINPDRIGFAHRFAEASKADRPVRLFTSLRQARQWVTQAMAERQARPTGITPDEAGRTRTKPSASN